MAWHPCGGKLAAAATGLCPHITPGGIGSLGPAAVLAVSSWAVSPQGDNSFVVMTNFIVTPGQKQGTCPEVNIIVPFSGLSFCNVGGLW